MRRLTIFAKGNVDVHDSLHSCRIGGQIRWNGINEVIRASNAEAVVRVRHETWTRSDAVLEATGSTPPEVAPRDLLLGSYPLASQFSTALFHADCDAVVLSILPEIATGLVRHARAGFLFYPSEAGTWASADQSWLRTEFVRSDLLDVGASMNNLRQIIEKIRSHADVPILIYNVSAIVPGDTVHCLLGLGEIFSTRCRRFNVGLADLSQETGISIIDVDAIVGRAGADKLKLDAMHLTWEGYRLVAEEVVRVLGDLGVLPMTQEPTCAPA
jgi:hypothetical protein